MKHEELKQDLTAEERAKRARQPRAVRPRLAATIVLWSGSRSDPRILMGRRAPRHDFMPSIYVFPGGRVDRADSFAPFVGNMPNRTRHILEAAMSPRRARALLLASIRETFEETGLAIGHRNSWTKNLTHPGWDAFRLTGLTPSLDGIDVFGRAVTPPHRHKRFDTWFLVRQYDGQTHFAKDSHELLDVDWFSFGDIEELKLARITKRLLAELKTFLQREKPPPHIFHSYMRGGQMYEDTFPR